jgi:hypothetical protein
MRSPPRTPYHPFYLRRPKKVTGRPGVVCVVTPLYSFVFSSFLEFGCCYWEPRCEISQACHRCLIHTWGLGLGQIYQTKRMLTKTGCPGPTYTCKAQLREGDCVRMYVLLPSFIFFLRPDNNNGGGYTIPVAVH